MAAQLSAKRILLLLAVGFAVGLLVVRQLLLPRSTVSEPALQADAEGHYVPGYRFSVGLFRFSGFTLRPEALVTFARTTSGTEDSGSCLEATIDAGRIHLRCDYPQVGIITIEGRFLTRFATNRLDTPVVSAFVTVRSRSGEILYNARDAFVWDSGK